MKSELAGSPKRRAYRPLRDSVWDTYGRESHSIRTYHLQLLDSPQVPTLVHEDALSTKTKGAADSPMLSSEHLSKHEFEAFCKASISRSTRAVKKTTSMALNETHEPLTTAGAALDESALKLALDIWDSICIDDELHWEFEDWVSLFETLPTLIVVLATRLSTGDAKVTPFRQDQLSVLLSKKMRPVADRPSARPCGRLALPF